ncbi:MAG: hypothetical protein FD123_3978 [Bacteroidetes bacterium]|nr:MAG: hypothetical protein FD123_3978 [Bacteroidota bacterium]
MKIVGWGELASRMDKSNRASALSCWYMEMQDGAWENAQEVQRSYPQARILGKSRVRFGFEDGLQVIVRFNFGSGGAVIVFAGDTKAMRKYSARKSPKK